MNSPTASGFSTWPRSPIRRRCPTRWQRCWASPNNPGRASANSVAAALEGRVRLLVFDNCEHVLDTVADLVEAILAASATVTILATSREGLGVSEEQLWRVPSLDVNSGTESAAVNLFVDRAQSVVSDFSLAQPGEADAVVEVCRRLDGIPVVDRLDKELLLVEWIGILGCPSWYPGAFRRLTDGRWPASAAAQKSETSYCGWPSLFGRSCRRSWAAGGGGWPLNGSTGTAHGGDVVVLRAERQRARLACAAKDGPHVTGRPAHSGAVRFRGGRLESARSNPM